MVNDSAWRPNVLGFLVRRDLNKSDLQWTGPQLATYGLQISESDARLFLVGLSGTLQLPMAAAGFVVLVVVVLFNIVLGIGEPSIYIVVVPSFVPLSFFLVELGVVVWWRTSRRFNLRDLILDLVSTGRTGRSVDIWAASTVLVAATITVVVIMAVMEP